MSYSADKCEHPRQVELPNGHQQVCADCLVVVAPDPVFGRKQSLQQERRNMLHTVRLIEAEIAAVYESLPAPTEPKEQP